MQFHIKVDNQQVSFIKEKKNLCTNLEITDVSYVWLSGWNLATKGTGEKNGHSLKEINAFPSI